MINKKSKVGIFGYGGMAKDAASICERIGCKKYIHICKSDRAIPDKKNVVSEDNLRSLKTEKYEFIIAISDAKVRKKIWNKNRNLEYDNLIHPDASVSNSAEKSIEQKRGNIICAGARIAGDVEIGSFCIFNLNSTVGHDCIVGDYSTIMPGANISGNVHLMQESVIGTGVSILQGASQEEKLQIGPKSTVGIGSVVMRSVPKERTVFGSPAEVLSSE